MYLISRSHLGTTKKLEVESGTSVIASRTRRTSAPSLGWWRSTGYPAASPSATRMSSPRTTNGCNSDQGKKILNYLSFKRMIAAKFDFHPESYSLPSERRDLLEAMKREEDSLWIVKPSNQCCGNGITVIKRFYGKLDHEITLTLFKRTLDLPSKFSKAPYCVQRYLRQGI